jgi:hypothetical protein
LVTRAGLTTRVFTGGGQGWVNSPEHQKSPCPARHGCTTGPKTTLPFHPRKEQPQQSGSSLPAQSKTPFQFFTSDQNLHYASKSKFCHKIEPRVPNSDTAPNDGKPERIASHRRDAARASAIRFLKFPPSLIWPLSTAGGSKHLFFIIIFLIYTTPYNETTEHI